MNPKVDFYFDKENRWKSEINALRKIVLELGLSEELKWGCPCYTWQNSNVVLIHVFKEYCAVLFMKGALLQDSENILIQQTENVQSARQIRFTSFQDVLDKASFLKRYIFEAIEVEKAGLKVELKKPAEFKMSEEFKIKIDESSELRNAFEALTPGRQRAYLLHFSQPKQAKTRETRVEDALENILAGKGLQD